MVITKANTGWLCLLYTSRSVHRPRLSTRRDCFYERDPLGTDFDAAGQHCAGPVSYTHLDVYKRQVYYDLTTGIMQYGNVSINGSLYYFDPVYGTIDVYKRQA